MYCLLILEFDIGNECNLLSNIQIVYKIVSRKIYNFYTFFGFQVIFTQVRLPPRMDIVSEIVEKIQRASIRSLRTMVLQALMDVERDVVDEIGSFRVLSENRDELLASFVSNMNKYFDELLNKDTSQRDDGISFDSLSLVEEEDYDAMMTVEAMVKVARKKHLPDFNRLHARLNAAFPDKTISEAENPLDPEQIRTAFENALRPLAMDAQNTLTVYKAFDTAVLANLDKVFQETDKMLKEGGIIANISSSSSKKPPPPSPPSSKKDKPLDDTFNTVEEVDENEEIEELLSPGDIANAFSTMQNLMHGGAAAAPGSEGSAGGVAAADGQVVAGAEQLQQYMVPGAMVPAGAADGSAGQAGLMQPFQPTAGQEVEVVDQTKLMEILSDIQKSVGTNLAASETHAATALEDADRVDITESLGELLNADQEDGKISAVDSGSSDVINMVTLLYGAIWEDSSVPIPIKELIGRTQITIIKVALSDNTFFDQEDHPAKTILNEFASSGIGWTEVENLEEDPLYQKMHQLVEKILLEFEGDVTFFEDLIKEFREFKSKEVIKSRRLEQSILKSKEGQERLDNIEELVTQKISERFLGRELDAFVRDLLESRFHKFMVKLVLKEGPGSNAWKQAINTIDVLLWSVQPHEQFGDRDRLATVNPRLLKNLRKALRLAAIETEEINSLISKLKEIQQASFTKEGDAQGVQARSGGLQLEDTKSVEEGDGTNQASGNSAEADPSMDSFEATEEEREYADYLEHIDAMTIGTWVDFTDEDEKTTRCKLAAKINAIDKFIFVNRDGVKISEKTKIGLAKELKAETLNIISGGPLFSRALESVINGLRDSQQEQQTGGAYQPTS